jgi:D-alanyl-D-alanine carboxypeptidase
MKYLISITVIVFSTAGLTIGQLMPKNADLARGLQTILETEVKNTPSIPGELLHVTSPRHRLNVSLADGLFDRKTRARLEPDQVFRVASVTKTFVAASILRLQENGKLKIDDPIAEHLPAGYIRTLKDDGYDPSNITVRQLLRHTSGLYDYATDQRYYAAVLGNPGRRWTRTEQLLLAMEWGGPLFPPGTDFKYSDTGYILLGEIVEGLTGKSLGSAMRALLDYKKLGLRQTYLETLEPVPPSARQMSHPYFREMDAVVIDASHDLYGGGGLVSSTEDLARFYRSLITGKVFKRVSTLEVMLSLDSQSVKGPDGAYAMGIMRRTINGIECWGHRGFWGTSAYHCPSVDVTIVRQLNQAQRANTFVFDNLYNNIFKLLSLESKSPAPSSYLPKNKLKALFPTS